MLHSRSALLLGALGITTAATAGCGVPSIGDLTTAPARSAPARSTAQPNAQPDAASDTGTTRLPGLRVMSFNLRVTTLLDLTNHWGLRKDVLANTVRRFDPDVLGTQECLPKQAAELRERLPGYRMVGVGRDDGAREGEMCAIFYRADRFRKLDAGHFWLSGQPETPGSKGWGAWFPRMVSWVKLQPTTHRMNRRLGSNGGVSRSGGIRGGVSGGVSGGGGAFYVFNTHLAVTASRARRRSAQLLRQRAADLAGGHPFVITGDFNAPEGSPPYDLLVGGSAAENAAPVPGLIDAFRAAHPEKREGIGTRHGFRGGRGGDRIDWILHTPHFQTLYASINRYHESGRYPSDHYPVQAILGLRSDRRHADAPATNPTSGTATTGTKEPNAISE